MSLRLTSAPWNFDFDPLDDLDGELEYRPLLQAISDSATLKNALPSPLSELRRCAALWQVRRANEDMMEKYFNITSAKRAENPLNRWLFEMVSMSRTEVISCLEGDVNSLQQRSQLISADISSLKDLPIDELTVPRDPLMPWPEAAIYTDVFTHAIASDLPHQPRTSLGRAADQCAELQTYANAVRAMLEADARAAGGEHGSRLESCQQLLLAELDDIAAYLTGGVGAPAWNDPSHPRFRITGLQNTVIAYNFAAHGATIRRFCAELAATVRQKLDEFGCRYRMENLMDGGQALTYRAVSDVLDDSRETALTPELLESGSVDTEADHILIHLALDAVTVTITASLREVTPELAGSESTLAFMTARAATELRLGREMFDKLLELYRLSTPGDPELKYFVRCLFCLTLRYHALFGDTGIGHNFHAAAPDSVFALLHSQAACHLELFASPYNCYFRRYCSAFPDTDVFFGSIGTFSSVKLFSGRFECGPPYTLGVMNDCARRVCQLLDRAKDCGRTLSVFIFVPEWKNPPSEYHQLIEQSPFLARMLVSRSRRHRYVSGAQFKPGGLTTKDRIWTCPHNTVLYGLTSGDNAERQLVHRLISDCQRLMETWQNDNAEAGSARQPRGRPQQRFDRW